MDNATIRALEADIARVLVRYCRAFDEGRFDEVADLFAPDAVFERPRHPPLRGKAEIGAFCRATPPAYRFRHMSSNILVRPIDVDAAVADSSFILFQGMEPGPDVACALDRVAMVGDYRDRLVRIGDSWRFARRRIEHAFVAPPLGG